MKKMEIICFAVGFVCGVLTIFLCKDRKEFLSTAQPEQKMPKELRAQYESLFGYDGKTGE